MTDLVRRRAERLILSHGAPLIQFWGWPGSGRGSLLKALLERHPELCAPFPLHAFQDRAALEETARRDVPYLLCPGWPEEGLEEALGRLGPHRRLVLTTRRRRRAPAGVAADLVTPGDLLLDAHETAALWRREAGRDLAIDTAESLRRATDGWYRPLCLAAAAARRGELDPARVGSEALLAAPGVDALLRLEVLGELAPEAVDALLEVSLADELDLALWREVWVGEPERFRLLEDLVAVEGLVIDGGGASPRLPRLLAAALARWRQRRWSAERVRAARRRLGLTLCGLGRPRPALEFLRQAGDRHRVACLERLESAGPPGGGDAEQAAAPAAAEAGPGRPADYIVSMLGHPAVQRRSDPGGYQELEWPLKRALKLLAYLATEPDGRASKEDLVEALWPEESEAKVNRNFHPTLSHLRRILGGGRRGRASPVLFSSGVYLLNPNLVWRVDAVEVPKLLEAGRIHLEAGDRQAAVHAWEGARRLYRGPYMYGFYDSWILARRETFQRLQLTLLRHLGEAYLAQERVRDALDAYRAVLLEDPLEEAAHVEVMRIYSSQGRRDLVRRQYDRLAGLLLEELGVEPLPETTAEYHRLMG